MTVNFNFAMDPWGTLPWGQVGSRDAPQLAYHHTILDISLNKQKSYCSSFICIDDIWFIMELIYGFVVSCHLLETINMVVFFKIT